MSNRRFEMFEYRAVLVRMRQGDSDRAIARAGLMRRTKARKFRVLAEARGWLVPDHPLPGGAGPDAMAGDGHGRRVFAIGAGFLFLRLDWG